MINIVEGLVLVLVLVLLIRELRSQDGPVTIDSDKSKRRTKQIWHLTGNRLPPAYNICCYRPKLIWCVIRGVH